MRRVWRGWQGNALAQPLRGRSDSADLVLTTDTGAYQRRRCTTGLSCMRGVGTTPCWTEIANTSRHGVPRDSQVGKWPAPNDALGMGVHSAHSASRTRLGSCGGRRPDADSAETHRLCLRSSLEPPRRRDSDPSFADRIAAYGHSNQSATRLGTFSFNRVVLGPLTETARVGS